MITDPELEQWSDLFRSETTDPTRIAARANRAVRNFRLWLWGEVAVTIVMGGGAVLWAAQSHQTYVTVLAVWVWISLAAAWVFRFFNDWNNFTGAAVPTGSHLAILRRRLRSNLRAARFGGALFFVQLFVTSAWVFLELNIGLRDYLMLPANVLFAFGTVVFCGWLFWYCRKLKSELAELAKLEDEFAGESTQALVLWFPAVLQQAINTVVTRLRKNRLRVF